MEATLCEKERAEMSNSVNSTRDIWEKVSYTWVISGADSVLVEGVGRMKNSPQIYNKGSDYAFKITMYPSGMSNEKNSKKDFVTLCLYALTKDTDMKYSVYIKDSKDNIIASRAGSRVLLKVGQICSFFNVVERSKLLSLIQDNCFKINSEFYIKLHSLEMKDYIIISGEDFPEIKLQRSMAELFESSRCSDIVFEVGAVKLKAHKNILSVRSPIFAAMFSHDTVEKHSGVVQIADIDSESFRRLLSFVYSGKVEIPDVVAAMDLYLAAEKYDMADLKLLCKNFMSSKFNSLNVGPILVIAEAFDDKDLKQRGMEYVLENFADFFNAETKMYKILESQNPKLLSELLAFILQKKCVSKA